jgi:PQQ-dependent dehydrogenase (methanol/ethanol family)
MSGVKSAILLAAAAVGIVSVTYSPIPAQEPIPQGPPAPVLQVTNFTPVTDRMLEAPDPGDWLMWRRTLNGWGYSPLNQINRQNVTQLKMIWTRGMVGGLQEATPLVHNGTMFLPNPGDVMQAINAATGDLIWEYRYPVPDDMSKWFAGAPLKNRNLAAYGDQIIDLSPDDFVYAVDARTGQPAWKTRIQDYRELSAQQTSGPIVAKGKVFSGRACEFKIQGEACVITAHDAKTGKELWRFHTIPKPGEPGDETWGGIPYDQRKHVGTWMPPSYDPELNLLYVGTSVTSPAPKFLLAGNDKKYLYHNSTLAIDADTGKLKWYYQHVVDHWDLDHPFERILVDTAVAPDASQVSWINPRIRPGERRRVITGIPGKTGIVYTLDRETGEFLWARPTNFQNVVNKIDGATGAVTVNPEATWTKAGEERLICPNMNGGKNFPAGAYSPLNNAIFMPVQNTCAIESPISDKIVPTSAYMLNTKPQLAPGTDKVGSIHAVSVETGKTLWKYEQRAGVLSLVTTGGGLLFGGDTNGRFRAFDQDTGKVLWEVNLGSPVNGFPISYAVNGKQYVAVSTGASLVSGGVNRLTPEIRPAGNNAIFVFSLP